MRRWDLLTSGIVIKLILIKEILAMLNLNGIIMLILKINKNRMILSSWSIQSKRTHWVIIKCRISKHKLCLGHNRNPWLSGIVHLLTNLTKMSLKVKGFLYRLSLAESLKTLIIVMPKWWSDHRDLRIHIKQP